MAFLVTIKFMAGKYEGLQYQYLKSNKLRCANKFFFAPKLYLTDIVDIEIATEESVKKLDGTIGGALIGGMVFSGVGAIVGAIGSGQTTETTLIITFRDGKKSLARANSPMMDAIRSHLFNMENIPGYGQGINKKMSLWKKAIVIFFALLLLAALNSENRKKYYDKQKSYEIDNPCLDIKNIDDWNKSSSLWRLKNSQCKPKI